MSEKQEFVWFVGKPEPERGVTVFAGKQGTVNIRDFDYRIISVGQPPFGIKLGEGEYVVMTTKDSDLYEKLVVEEVEPFDYEAQAKAGAERILDNLYGTGFILKILIENWPKKFASQAN